MAIRHGASALGLVSEMPSGPGVIAEETIAEIARSIPPAVGAFLLTSRQDARTIIEQQRRLRVSTLQICDRLKSGSHRDLREALPGIAIVQVVHVVGPESVAEAAAVAPQVDAILLDSGDPGRPVKELGGTGRRHGGGGRGGAGGGRPRPPPRLAAQPSHPGGGRGPDLPGRGPQPR
jgi:phosphoribosylanthranilate isomerase